jgi:bifunctional UDP-N-acetylglucosamine pyrophosphorylase/glucosamine-1-phosphate N-acetyltransferase
LRARRTELPYERRDYCLAYDPTFTARFVTTPLNVAILAAGQGKRMYSSLPKVLHPLAGRPLVAYVVDTARALAPRAITIVTGQGSDAVAAALAAPDLAFVVQDPPRGTGDATRIALSTMPGDGVTLVGLADVPLAPAADLVAIVDHARRGDLGLLTARVPDRRTRSHHPRRDGPRDGDRRR